MSAERALSPSGAPRTTLRLIAAFLLGLALGSAAALLVTARATDAARRRVTARAYSPDKSRVAVAHEAACTAGLCQELKLGPTDGTSQTVASLTNRSCAEIVWTPDGTRVAFVLDGSEMTIYDAQTAKLAGTVRLLTAEATQTRFARGVTFSENGRAATFDDCPRSHSGCRAVVVGVPQ
jgi:Tol biopolymer transport system component